jgi:uncharacterized protein
VRQRTAPAVAPPVCSRASGFGPDEWITLSGKPGNDLEKQSQQGNATQELTADDPTVELEMLEQTLSIDGARELRFDPHGLTPAPLPRAWIIEGNPVARDKPLIDSGGRLPRAIMWDCTAGRFDWSYEDDEVAHVLEGLAIIEDAAGVRQMLHTGDTFLFRAGSRYQWTVPNYVRKIAFSYSPVSPQMRFIKGIIERLAAPFRRKPAWTTARNG